VTLVDRVSNHILSFDLSIMHTHWAPFRTLLETYFINMQIYWFSWCPDKLTKPGTTKPDHHDIGLGLGNEVNDRIRVRNRDRVK